MGNIRQEIFSLYMEMCKRFCLGENHDLLKRFESLLLDRNLLIIDKNKLREMLHVQSAEFFNDVVILKTGLYAQKEINRYELEAGLIDMEIAKEFLINDFIACIEEQVGK